MKGSRSPPERDRNEAVGGQTRLPQSGMPARTVYEKFIRLENENTIRELAQEIRKWESSDDRNYVVILCAEESEESQEKCLERYEQCMELEESRPLSPEELLSCMKGFRVAVEFKEEVV